MKVILNEKDKVSKFACVFKHLKQFSSDINMYFNETGLYTQGMDGSHVCLFELSIISDWFSSYEVEKNQVIGVNCELIFKIFNCLEEFQSIEIIYNEGDKLKINLIPNEGVRGIVKEFEMPLVDIDSELLAIPDTDYSADIEINSNEFRELITQVSIFGTDITFNCHDEIKITGDGEYGAMNAIISENDISMYQIEEDSKLNLTFAGKYLQDMCSFSRINSSINLHFSQDTPMKMQYNMDDNDEENCVNYIRFFLAPKIEDF